MWRIKPQNSRKLISIQTHTQRFVVVNVIVPLNIHTYVYYYSVIVLFLEPLRFILRIFFVYFFFEGEVSCEFFFSSDLFLCFQVVLNFWDFPLYKFATLNTTPQTYVFSHTNVHMYV